MKKLIYGISFLALVGIAIVGCKTDNLSLLREMETTKIEDFFDEVSKMNLETSDENIIYINYEWNKNDSSFSIIEVKEAEPEFFILESTKDQSLRKKAATNYIECSNGDNSWTERCDGKFTCSGLIVDCLNEGGCATICVASMAYAPQINTFYIGSAVSTPKSF